MKKLICRLLLLAVLSFKFFQKSAAMRPQMERVRTGKKKEDYTLDTFGTSRRRKIFHEDVGDYPHDIIPRELPYEDVHSSRGEPSYHPRYKGPSYHPGDADDYRAPPYRQGHSSHREPIYHQGQSSHEESSYIRGYDDRFEEPGYGQGHSRLRDSPPYRDYPESSYVPDHHSLREPFLRSRDRGNYEEPSYGPGPSSLREFPYHEDNRESYRPVHPGREASSYHRSYKDKYEELPYQQGHSSQKGSSYHRVQSSHGALSYHRLDDRNYESSKKHQKSSQQSGPREVVADLTTKWIIPHPGDLVEREIHPGNFRLFAVFDGESYWQLDKNGKFAMVFNKRVKIEPQASDLLIHNNREVAVYTGKNGFLFVPTVNRDMNRDYNVESMYYFKAHPANSSKN